MIQQQNLICHQIPTCCTSFGWQAKNAQEEGSCKSSVRQREDDEKAKSEDSLPIENPATGKIFARYYYKCKTTQVQRIAKVHTVVILPLPMTLKKQSSLHIRLSNRGYGQNQHATLEPMYWTR